MGIMRPLDGGVGQTEWDRAVRQGYDVVTMTTPGLERCSEASRRRRDNHLTAVTPSR